VTTLGACAALAVLELDATLAVQTLASRPLVVGCAFGALSGAPQAGALLGATLELLSLADLPVGGCLTWSAPVAAGTAAMLAGRGVSAPVCLAGGVAAGIVHSRLEALERSRRAATGDAVAAKAAETGGLGGALTLSLAAHAAMTLAVAYAAVAAFAALDRAAWPSAPEFARAGAGLAAEAAPWLGLAGVAGWGLRR
jgi:mannose/fructose/N-acetylgalactosamine-specific phosphotransferase system component IIC